VQILTTSFVVKGRKIKNHCPRSLMFSRMKTTAIAVGTAVVGLFGLAYSAFAADAIITLPTTAVADLTGNASEIMTDVWVLVALAIGIPMGFYIIRKVIALIPKH